MEPLKEEQEDTTVLNDEAMKELSEQLLEKFRDNEYLTERLMSENIELKKNLATLYGLIRSLDSLVDGSGIDEIISNFIDVARGISSEYMNQHFFDND